MSRAKQRLIHAWGSLIEDVVDVTLAFCDCHHGSNAPGARRRSHANPATAVRIHTGDPNAFTVPVDLSCPAAYTGTLGEVNVGIIAPKADAYLAHVDVWRAEPGRTVMALYDTVAPAIVVSGQDHLSVSLAHPNIFPPGLYFGRVQDVTGLFASTFVIYLDGL